MPYTQKELMRHYYFTFGGIVIAMVAYLSFLDYRDQQLFDSYNRCLNEECRK